MEARNTNGSDAAANKVALTEEIRDMAIPPWSSGFNSDQNSDFDVKVREIIENIVDENEE